MQQDHLQSLRNQGYRLTRQRLLILEVIQASSQHLTADEIFVAAVRQHPKLNLATVYRTLQWLHSVGLLRKIDVGEDRMEYEYAGGHMHHHLICKHCGATREIDNHVAEALQAHIREHYDFEADTEHLAIFGRCAACRSAGRHS